MENNENVQATTLEEKIKIIENLDEITLANTVGLMIVMIIKPDS